MNNFTMYYQCLDKNMYRKILRNEDETIDIFQMRRGNDLYRIWSSCEIKGIPLLKKSKNKNEARPFIYKVNKNELLNIFPGLNINNIDKEHYKKIGNKYLIIQ